MARYLIEVPHEENIAACIRVVEVFLKSGSHFLTHADWGCEDGVHKAWIIAELENKEEALRIIPPAFRSEATITCLNQFTIEEVEIMKHHKG